MCIRDRACAVGRATSTHRSPFLSGLLPLCSDSFEWFGLPRRSCILPSFPDSLWVFQYLSMPCKVGVCQFNPTALGLLGSLPVCAQMGSDCRLWKGIPVCRPAQCCHTLPEVCLCAGEDVRHAESKVSCSADVEN